MPLSGRGVIRAGGQDQANFGTKMCTEKIDTVLDYEMGGMA